MWLITQFEKYFWLYAMWIAVLLGIYFRFKGLTVWPLAADEFYLTRSVQQILECGLPRFDCDGSFYNRGILQQYISAFLQWMGFSEVFSMRIVPAVCSLGVLPAAYHLSRKAADSVPVACITVVILSLSLWEIELSRYARMYIPFQLLFVWYLVFLCKYTLHKDLSSKWLMYFLSILSVFLWEGGIFVLLLNFSPLLFHREKLNPLHCLVSGILLLAGYFYLKIEFRFINGINPYPADIETPISSINTLALPKLLILSASQNVYWLMAALAVAVCSIYWCWRLFTKHSFGLWQCSGFSALVALSWLNQLGAMFALAALMLIAGWFSIDDIKREVLLKGIIIIVLNFAFWLVYALSSSVWVRQLGFSDNPNPIIKTFLKIIIKFPNILDKVIYTYWVAVPIQTCLFGLTAISVALFSIFEKENRNENFSVLLSTFIIGYLLVGLVNTTYTSTRYSFFLYPLLIIVITAGVQQMLKHILKKRFSSLVYLSTVTLVFAISEDFNMDHLLNIDSKRAHYRLDYFADNHKLAQHFMLRLDYKSPSEYINSHANEDDIIVSTAEEAYLHLHRLNYSYVPFFYTEFRVVSCSGGTKHRWTNKPLIYSEGSLKQLIENAESDVWIIIHKHRFTWFTNQVFLNALDENIVMESDAGNCCVVFLRKGTFK